LTTSVVATCDPAARGRDHAPHRADFGESVACDRDERRNRGEDGRESPLEATRCGDA